MKYKFIPDSIKDDNITLFNINRDEFLNLQIVYKQAFEKILEEEVDFCIFDNWINKINTNLPVVNDKEFNFYRRYSTLGSDYLYLRNNIHIERLNFDEINELKSGITRDFLLKTYKIVLFENGDYTYFGNATDMNLIPSKSLVFEFAFDAKECKDLEEYNFYKHYKDQIFEFIAKPIEKKLNCSVSIHRYSAIPELFIDESKQINL